MTSEIRSLPLGKVCALIYRYPSFYGMEKHSEGVPVVRGEHLMPDGTISTNWDDYWFVAPEVSERYPKTVLALDDVVMSVRGTVGAFARVGKEHVGAQISPNLIRLSPDPKVLVPRYLFYALRFPGIKEAILGGVASSAVPALKASDIKRTCILVPPLADQQRIVEILGGIDDWIDLLKQETVTLEAIARAIFKSWFIDFDPVRAKAEDAKSQGLDAKATALFPIEFEQSKLGLIPKGWRVTTVEEVATVTSGKRPTFLTDKPSSDACIPIYGGAGLMAWTTSALTNGPIVITGRVGTLGKVFFVDGPCWPSDNTLVIRSAEEITIFLYFYLKSVDLSQLNRGSTQPMITQTDVKKIVMVMPSAQVLFAFRNLVAPIFAKIRQNTIQASTLSSLRDTLLPRLISGKLRVPEAEEALKEVL